MGHQFFCSDLQKWCKMCLMLDNTFFDTLHKYLIPFDFPKIYKYKKYKPIYMVAFPLFSILCIFSLTLFKDSD